MLDVAHEGACSPRPIVLTSFTEEAAQTPPLIPPHDTPITTHAKAPKVPKSRAPTTSENPRPPRAANAETVIATKASKPSISISPTEKSASPEAFGPNVAGNNAPKRKVEAPLKESSLDAPAVTQSDYTVAQNAPTPMAPDSTSTPPTVKEPLSKRRRVVRERSFPEWPAITAVSRELQWCVTRNGVQ